MWTDQDSLYWTSLNLKIEQTEKPFYNKYLYKLQFDCPSIRRYKWKLETAEQVEAQFKGLPSLRNAQLSWGIFYTEFRDGYVAPDKNSMHVIAQLANFARINADHSMIRCEGSWCSIYTNDPKILNEFLQATHPYFADRSSHRLFLKSITVPNPQVSYGDVNVVYKRKLPYNKYSYRVNISTSKKPDFVNRGINFLSWADQADTILLPNNARDNLTNKSYSYGKIYFYATDLASVQMSQFLLGDSINSIQEFRLFDK